MKLFRRIVFYALLLSLFISCIGMVVSAQGQDGPGPIFFSTALLGLLGTVAWCAVFLKIEVNLARAGLVIVAVGLCLGGLLMTR